MSGHYQLVSPLALVDYNYTLSLRADGSVTQIGEAFLLVESLAAGSLPAIPIKSAPSGTTVATLQVSISAKSAPPLVTAKSTPLVINLGEANGD